jgi:hypothetical protein
MHAKGALCACKNARALPRQGVCLEDAARGHTPLAYPSVAGSNAHHSVLKAAAENKSHELPI